MQLPTTIKVGKTVYRVEQPEAMRALCSRGDIDYGKAIIKVAYRSKLLPQPYTQRQRREVFWHELTHAVLNDMKSKLAYDELFVSVFAKKLSDAIDSATFD